MKSKTNFKQMYLVDANAYNRINNTTISTPTIFRKSNIQISPPALNVSVSAPVKTEKENVISSNSIFIIAHNVNTRLRRQQIWHTITLFINKNQDYVILQVCKR